MIHAEAKATAEKPIFVKSNIKLSIGVLVSNNIKYIRKGFESIRPILKEVPSELIVVDTVGEEKSDGSLAVAREYTDKIYHFDWINDFSAARNVAIEHACGEWFMFYDDDEYFDDVTELIDFFRSGECERYNSGTYFSGNYVKPDKMQKTIVARLAKRTTETRFVGIIHEYLHPSYMPIKQLNTFTHHFGYLYADRESAQAKRRRNIPLLEKEIEVFGLNAKRCAQLVQEIYTFDRESAIKKCTEYIKILEKTEEINDPLGQWMLVERVRYMADIGSVEGALDVERDILSKYHLMELPGAVVDQVIAEVAFYNERWELAAERVKDYFLLHDWLMCHEEERNWQSRLDLSNFIMDECLFNTAKMGLISEKHLHNYEKAYSYIERLDYRYCDEPDGIRDEIEEILLELPDATKAVDYYKRLYKEDFFRVSELRKYLPKALACKIS